VDDTTGWRRELALLFESERERLRSVALRILRDPTEAEDAVQDGFASACRNIGSFRGQAQLSTWLHRIVCNAALMHLRSRRRRRESPLEEGFEAPANPELLAPDEELARRQISAEVLRALERLDPKSLELLEARYFRDEPLQRIARRHRISRGAAKTRVHRARASLRRVMEEGAWGYNAAPGTPTRASEAS
jgi:RNA polymerase sigma-70 factor (ECF subfamily)